MIFSVSMSVWKIAPLSISSCLTSCLLIRLPLCTTEISPNLYFAKTGCASPADSEPAVEYLLCPTAHEPSSLSSVSCENTSATIPRFLYTVIFSPLATEIPVASCPRCCIEKSE